MKNHRQTRPIRIHHTTQPLEVRVDDTFCQLLRSGFCESKSILVGSSASILGSGGPRFFELRFLFFGHGGQVGDLVFALLLSLDGVLRAGFVGVVLGQGFRQPFPLVGLDVFVVDVNDIVQALFPLPTLAASTGQPLQSFSIGQQVLIRCGCLWIRRWIWRSCRTKIFFPIPERVVNWSISFKISFFKNKKNPLNWKCRQTSKNLISFLMRFHDRKNL